MSAPTSLDARRERRDRMDAAAGADPRGIGVGDVQQQVEAFAPNEIGQPLGTAKTAHTNLTAQVVRHLAQPGFVGGRWHGQ